MNEPITEQLYNKVVNFVNKMDGSVRFDYISKSDILISDYSIYHVL